MTFFVALEKMTDVNNMNNINNDIRGADNLTPVMCDFGSDEDVDEKDSRDEKQKEDDREERIRRGLEPSPSNMQTMEKTGGTKLERHKAKKVPLKKPRSGVKGKGSSKVQSKSKSRSKLLKSKTKSRTKSKSKPVSKTRPQQKHASRKSKTSHPVRKVVSNGKTKKTQAMTKKNTNSRRKA